MARSIQKYLYDIQQSISSIEEYLGEKRDFFAYEQNKLLRRAVERELEIIGFRPYWFQDSLEEKREARRDLFCVPL